MKLNLKTILIILIIAVLIYLIFKYFLKSNSQMNEKSIKDTLKDIANIYGQDIAIYTEKIARLESNHFKDDKAIRTKNYGFMLAFTDIDPWGWNELQGYWRVIGHKPTGAVKETNGFKYLTFATPEDGLYNIAFKLNNLKAAGRSFGYYFSKDDKEAAEYLSKLNNIKNQYV